jgi:hypothetical protein
MACQAAGSVYLDSPLSSVKNGQLAYDDSERKQGGLSETLSALAKRPSRRPIALKLVAIVIIGVALTSFVQPYLKLFSASQYIGVSSLIIYVCAGIFWVFWIRGDVREYQKWKDAKQSTESFQGKKLA